MFVNLQRSWYRKRLKDPYYDFLFSSAPDNEWVCFDCETTGLNPKKDRVLAISAIRIKENQIITSGCLNLTVRQKQPVSTDSIKIHHLRETDLLSGISEREAVAQFLDFIGSRPLVGYYLEFDVAMINQILLPWLGIKLPNKQIEVSEQYYQYKEDIIPQKVIDLSFQKILEELDIPNLGQHDAFNDALMTSLIFLKLRQLQKT